MTPKGLWFVLGAACLALVETGWSQRASNWRVYKKADGLPGSACLSVSIPSPGKVLVKHLSPPGVSELDGYSVRVIPSEAPGNGRVYGSPGGQLWTVVPEGLKEFRDGVWVLHPVPEIAAEFRTGVTRLIDPVPLCPVRLGVVIFLLPDRLLEFNTESPEGEQLEVLHTASQTRLQKLSGMVLARNGGLWVAGARGLAKVPGPVRNLKPAAVWQEFLLPDSLELQNLQTPEEGEDGSVTVVAESAERQKKVAVRFDGTTWTTGPAGPQRIRHAWRGPDSYCWASTIDSLFQWEDGGREMVENEELSARQYFDLAVEPGGSFWLATSEGLFRYNPLPWRSPVPIRHLSALVPCLTADQQGRLWFVGGSSLFVLQEERQQEFHIAGAGFGSFQSARGLFLLSSGTLLLNVEDRDLGQRLIQFEPETGIFKLIPARPGTEQSRILGVLQGGNLAILSFSSGAGDKTSRLETFDGADYKPFPEPPPGPLLGGGLTTLFAAQNGDIWVSGELGTAYLHEKQWRTFLATDPMIPKAALAFAEVGDGKIWCATQDRIWEFDSRSWSEVRGGFDRVNGMLRARDGTVWVASNSGLLRLFQGSWIENGVEEGLASPTVRAIYEDPRGRIWAGTSRGLDLLHPEADTDPPHTTIGSLKDSEKNVPEGGSISLAFSGEDRWKNTPQERLLYSYRLDEGEWSPFQEQTHKSFTDLPAGKHYFKVRALDRLCNPDPNPAKLDFAVVLPWYKERRLVLISFSGLVGALFFAGLAFNRHRQLMRSYAEVEQKVTQRTRELEIANRELLHSQKMTALGTLAAGIAHDFNNILSIVKGSAQIIEENLDNPSKVQTRVDRIKTVVEQGAGIVKAMLGFSRDSDEQPAACELTTVVDDTIKLLGDRFLREVQISFKPEGNLPPVPASKNLIQQILLNFIFNAAESMSERKQITLTARTVNKLPEALVLTPAPAGQYVAVSVTDSGAGISLETMPRIFEPFFTTKALSARRGTGLGLSMAYELARKMSAGLAVESSVGHGSTFTLILPVQESSDPSQIQSSKAVSQPTDTGNSNARTLEDAKAR